MNIYFCDSCGKRFTEDKDPVTAMSSDQPRKNLCHDCTSTTSTIETVPLVLKSKTPAPYKVPSTRTSEPIIIVPPSARTRKSSARLTPVKPSTDAALPALDSRVPVNANKYIYSGVGLAVVAVSCVFLLSSKPGKNSGGLTATEQPPAAPPVQEVHKPAPVEPPQPVERPEVKEERAKAAFDELELRVDAMSKDDPAGKQATEAFLREFGDTAQGPRGRQLLENLVTAAKKTGTATGTASSTATASGPASAEEELKHILAKMKVLNPGFDGKSTQKIVSGKVISLTLNSTNLTSLMPLHDLASLDELILDSKTTSKLADLSPLSGMKITKLTVTHASVEVLSPLTSLSLTNLELSFNPVLSLAPLSGLKLKDLGIANTNVADLSPLHDMPIANLRIGSTRITDLSPLKGMPLANLGMMRSSVTDLAPLRGLPLKTVNAAESSIEDISGLHGTPLTNLNISGTKVTDLSPLTGTPLAILDMSKTAVKDLSPLKGLPLTQLIMNSTQVEDLSPLEGLPITKLQISGVPFHDLATLQKLPALAEILVDLKAQEEVDLLRTCGKLKAVNWKPAQKFLEGWKPPPKK